MLSDVMDAYEETFVLVEYHVNDGYEVPWGYPGRWDFYDGYYIPETDFDGLIEIVGAESFSYYEEQYETRRSDPTNITIEMIGEQVSGQTYQITATVCVEPEGSTMNMRVYMVDVLDNYACTYCRNTFRQAAATVDISLSPGECYDVVRNFTFDSISWSNQEDIKIVAWAQKQASGYPATVFQAAWIGWPFPFPCTTNEDCDDGIVCTIDECIVPNCVRTPDDGLCDDGVACTDDACDAVDDCQFIPNDAYCDDSVECTDDTCDAVEGCQFTPNDANCDDSVACTDDTCDPVEGCQSPPNDANCDDSVGCTDDTCDAVNDCQFAPNDANCDDGVGCTGDTCDAVNDCQITPNDANCDDGIGCTDDTCDTVDDCQFTINDANCNDSEACTVDTCDPGHELADPDGCVNEYRVELFADVYPVPYGDGAVEGFDILCVLDQANDISRPDCLNADIYPCDGGDGAIEGFDILAVLDTAGGLAPEPTNYVCPDPCP